MSSLIRWEPFRDFVTLRDVMDRLVEDTFSGQPGNLGLVGTPAIDLVQTDDEVIVKAALPGVKADDLNISITGDVLTLRGEVKEETARQGASYHMRERRFGSFSRSISLPAAVVADKARAEFENGVLTLNLPKAEDVKPKTITVKAK